MNLYIGHDSQIWSVEEHRLVGGKGDGMRLLEISSGTGVHLTVSLDRAADISRLRFRGINMGYFSPCGYVGPAYYDRREDHFLKSFTAGFLTTCGLESAGVPCEDGGEQVPMHGSIANIPAEYYRWEEEDGEIVVYAQMRDEVIFGRKLKLIREIRVSLTEASFTICDRIVNEGDRTEPIELLYHMNMGYPLLDEDSIVEVSSEQVRPRNAHAAEDLENWMHMEKPQAGYEERCYYHECKKEGRASICQPKLGIGLEIRFDPKKLDCFTEWKMMGVRDYVLGLECGNCYPDGRDVMRRDGRLKFLEPGKTLTYHVKVRLLEK